MLYFLALGAPHVLIIILIGLLFPLIAVVDIVMHEFTGNNKLIWLLVVIFFSFFGTILYFLIGRSQRIK